MSEWIEILRIRLAARLLTLALKVALPFQRKHYAKGIDLIASEILKSLESPKTNYHPVRFFRICQELGLDPHKVIELDQGEITAVVQQFSAGQMDEVQVMTALRNLSILNGGKWKR